MRWTEQDLQRLKNKGLRIEDKKTQKTKIVKISVEKRTIDLVLQEFKQKGLITDYVTEHKFHDVRRFRFDWAIVDLKIAIEYEGIFSKKSRHTTVKGYSIDIEKYNLALTEGWKVLRYTANNYQDLKTDLEKLI